MSRVFITGATGYIGGEALYALLQSGKFEITALVRSEARAKLLPKEVKTVTGSLDDIKLIQEQVAANDIIVNTADVDHVTSTKILADTLIASKEPKILIHTSGTSILGDGVAADKPAPKVYYDDDSIDEINSFPAKQPHRPVDELVLDINDKNPLVKTAIVCPSTIYGVSHGYGRIISQQIPNLIILAYQQKSSFSVYHGNYIWNHIHIHDLGTLYFLILTKLLNGEDIPQGRKGYYFGSYALPSETITDKPSSIEHVWRDVSQAVGTSLHKRGLIPTDKVLDLEPDYLIKINNDDPFTPYSWGTNSRSRGNNGYKIGWKPQYEAPKYFWDSIEDDIDHIIRNKWLDAPL